MAWTPIPLEAKLYTNIDETQLTRAQAAIENASQTESGGFSRFPGLKAFATLPDNGRVYLHDFRGDLIAATSKGQVYTVDQAGNALNKTAAAVGGGMRVTFAKTDDELLMAAGKEIIRFDGGSTDILSGDAPLASFVAYIDSYVLANEVHSGRFFHAEAGAPRTWDPLDTFAADGKPDNISALVVTPFREVILAGPESTEQFERLSSGDTPFFRRWSAGEGVYGPHLIAALDDGVIMVNRRREIVRLSGQTGQPIGDDIGRTIEGIDDWTDAWIGGFPDQPLNVAGQRYALLQVPFASTPYGTKGRTFCHDFRKQRWVELYGWDANLGVPTRWPGWSYWNVWGRTFVGGEGAIYEIDHATFTNVGVTQRVLFRTAHLAEQGEIDMTNLRVFVKRGVGSYTTEPLLSIRCKRDNRHWGRWVRRGLGLTGRGEMPIEFGGFGQGNAFQFEIEVTDACELEVRKIEADVERIGD